MSPLDECERSTAALACRASLYGYIIGGPALLVAGTIGNLWTSLVVTRWRLRKNFTAALIMSHAVLDTMVLWTGLSRHIYLSLTGVDVRETSQVVCKAQRFALYVTMDASATILVAVSADRFAAVWLPHQRKRFTVAKAWAFICALTAASVAFNMHVLWTRGEQVIIAHDAPAGASNRTSVRACGYPRPEYKAFWAGYQGWLGMAYFCLLPFVAMVVLNSLTVAKLRSQYRARRSWGDDSGGPHLTIMLLVASMFFICVTAPAFLYNNIEAMSDQSGLDEASMWRLRATDTYATLLQYLNHAINFYMYTLTGKGFRRDVRTSVRRVWTRRRPGPSTTSMTTTAGSSSVNGAISDLRTTSVDPSLKRPVATVPDEKR